MDVFLIIDMQKASFSNAERYDADGVVNRINQLSSYIRNNGGTVIFIQHDGTPEDGHVPFTSGWEILPSLSRDESDRIVRKTICDAFYKTDLYRVLNELKVDRLIISGCATDFCVDTTVRAAVSLDYHVIVAADCHTTADRPHLTAEQVIRHHNWVWSELLVPEKKVEVLSLETLLKM